jgi:hypothetical protein
LYLDIFTSVKSRDLNHKQFQLDIKGFGVLERRILIQFGIQFHRKGIELLPERKWTFISRDLTVNIQASFKLHKFDLYNCIVLYSGTPQNWIPLKTEHLV